MEAESHQPLTPDSAIMSTPVKSTDINLQTLVLDFLCNALIADPRWEDIISVATTSVATPSLLDPLQKRLLRLINTRAIELEESPSNHSMPSHAILSQEGQEISYQEMINRRSGLATWLSIHFRRVYKKIITVCRQTRQGKHPYIQIESHQLLTPIGVCRHNSSCDTFPA
ncbi:hypothetical protein D9758_013733 [Tetrapyrgos nigripes]|uniref:Uncharacterized protein n=1 Tax=Tetrapyrgos nigripes TaxID=182062 RepID=A0A8H5G1M6_9AGAR|nr:hypothetical protein D9758_013733 [Tetrapyrgos nigripes]